jgi:CRISPR/Cas system-associated exonuclease Cas4 (RecB family)
MLTLAELRAQPHTSVSQLKTYIQCPKKHNLQYIAKIQPAFRALALVFGTAWHATIGEYLLRSTREHPVSEEELQAHLRDGIVNGIAAEGVPVLFEEEDQDAGVVVDLGLRMLKVFLEKVKLPTRVLGVEVPFSLEVSAPNTGEISPRPLIGAMDAIVEEAGHAVIWELKTGAKKWSADQLEFDLQPTAYVAAASALGHRECGVTLLVTTKSKTPDVQVEKLVRHQRDERELVDVVLGVQRAVQAGVEYPVRGWQCRTCPFAGACGS